jgi:hypothetical protein
MKEAKIPDEKVVFLKSVIFKNKHFNRYLPPI